MNVSSIFESQNLWLYQQIRANSEVKAWQWKLKKQLKKKIVYPIWSFPVSKKKLALKSINLFDNLKLRNSKIVKNWSKYIYTIWKFKSTSDQKYLCLSIYHTIYYTKHLKYHVTNAWYIPAVNVNLIPVPKQPFLCFRNWKVKFRIIRNIAIWT